MDFAAQQVQMKSAQGGNRSLSTPMGVDYAVIGFDMDVQPLVTQNAACPVCVSAICIDVVRNRLLFAHMP